MGFHLRAEIDGAALRHNIGVIRRTIGPSCHIMAVVKANAYGLGASTLAPILTIAGCHALAVNDVEEAIELREGGVTEPILLLAPLAPHDVAAAVRHDLTITLHSAHLLDAIETEAKRQARVVRLHLKVDTGLTRLGVTQEQAIPIAASIASRPHLTLEALYTHLASAMSGDSSAMQEQLVRFERVRTDLARAHLLPPLTHVANSAALFCAPKTHYDLVRPGIALFGMDPGLFATRGLDIRPALSLRTEIIHLHTVSAGTGVGYEQTYLTPRDTVIATCPGGYDDGYPWQLSNRGTAIIRGQRVPIVGRISMNYMTLDVGTVPEIAVGDPVTLIGRDGAEEIRIEEIARAVGTIPYELTCRLGRRVHRVAVDRTANLEIGGALRRVAIA